MVDTDFSVSTYFNKMKKIGLFLTLILLLTQLPVYADTNETQSIPFEIHIETPENQLEGLRSYFNLNVAPNTKQIVNVIVKNTSNAPIELKASAANALTSPLGGIAYVKEQKTEYSRLTDKTYYMDTQIDIPNEIKLGPLEEKRIPVTITVPDKNSGTLLGGLLFTLKDFGEYEKETEDKELAFTIKNKLEYAIAIQLNLPNKLTEVVPLQIHDTKMKIDPSGANIMFELENKNADIIKGISYKYKVVDKKGNELFSGEITPFNVAPKSRAFISIPWQYENLKNGEYELLLNPSDSEQTVTKDFDVKRKVVKEYAEKTGKETSIPMLDIPHYFWIIIIAVIFLVIFIAYKLGRKKEERAGANKKIA